MGPIGHSSDLLWFVSFFSSFFWQQEVWRMSDLPLTSQPMFITINPQLKAPPITLPPLPECLNLPQFGHSQADSILILGYPLSSRRIRTISFLLWQGGALDILIPVSRVFPSEKAMATHSSTLAWKILWTEEPGRLQSMGLQRVRHD